MKKNTKKKVLTLTLVILLLSIAIVGGSLAWFTAEDQVDNVFTVGSIKVDQHEQQPDGNGGLKDFEQGKILMPIVNTDDPANDENYEHKIVTVENTGKNPAYVRTHIAIPTALVDYLHTDVVDLANSNWKKEGTYVTEYEGMSYTVTYYYYNATLGTEDNNKTTTQLLKGVYMDSAVDVKDNPSTDIGDTQFCILKVDGTYGYSGFMVNADTQIKVLVATQAVQAEGFEGDAYKALDSAFDAPTATSNPFVN